MFVITIGIELAAQRATSVRNGVTWALLGNAMLVEILLGETVAIQVSHLPGLPNTRTAT